MNRPLEKKSRMICSQAEVIGEAGSGWAVVEVKRSSMCEGCSENGSCLTSLESGKKMDTRVRNPLGAKTGDLVELSINESIIVWGTVVCYLLPVLFLLIFLAAGLYLKDRLGWGWSEDIVGIAGGSLGLVLSLPVIRLLSTRWKKMSGRVPEISKILSGNGL